jgi:hypothetical protein
MSLRNTAAHRRSLWEYECGTVKCIEFCWSIRTPRNSQHAQTSINIRNTCDLSRTCVCCVLVKCRIGWAASCYYPISLKRVDWRQVPATDFTMLYYAADPTDEECIVSYLKNIWPATADGTDKYCMAALIYKLMLAWPVRNFFHQLLGLFFDQWHECQTPQHSHTSLSSSSMCSVFPIRFMLFFVTRQAASKVQTHC